VNGGAACGSDSYTIALYNFDSANNGLITDSGPLGRTLTVNGSPTLANNTTWMATPSGKVARFSGAADYLTASFAPAEIFPGGQIHSLTIEAWIYPRAFNPIFMLYQDYNSGNPPTASQWGLQYDQYLSPNAPRVYANAYVMSGLDNTGWYNLVALNTWHKLVITYNASSGTTSAYIDGTVPISTCSSCPPINDPNTQWTLSFGNFDGDIDEVRISSKVRTAPTNWRDCWQ
jgi:hypothetical protein